MLHNITIILRKVKFSSQKYFNNTRDKFKFTSAANYIYERALSNGNYTQAQAEVGFNTTIEHGKHADHVVFGNLTLDAKRGRSNYEAGAHYIATKDTKLGFAGIGYTYQANNWNFGANIDYVRGSMFREKVDYFATGIKAAYNF